MNIYYVETHGGRWRLVKARTKREAKSDGIKEYGRGSVATVTRANEEQVAYYVQIFGSIDEARSY